MHLIGIPLQIRMDPSGIERYIGTYRGISPTDESPIGFGEIEIIIEKDRIDVRMATGLKIENGGYRTGFASVPKEELQSLVDDPDTFDQVTVFRDEMGFVYWFAPSECGDVGVLRSGGMGDLLGPTVLLRNLSGEKYDEIMEPLEGQGMPLLRYEGRTSPDTHK